MGCIWLGIFIANVLFIYNYLKYYYLGVVKGYKAAAMLYKDLDRKARRIAMGFVMYMTMSVLVLIINFDKCQYILIRGALLGSAVYPALNNTFGDKDRYRFSL